MFDVSVLDEFSAAHRLVEYNGDCERLHGHNWKVRAVFRSHTLNSQGLAIDFRIARSMLRDILKSFDHAFLNDVPLLQSLNPSCEHLAQRIYESLRDKLMSVDPDLTNVSVYEVTVWESDRTNVTYREVVS